MADPEVELYKVRAQFAAASPTSACTHLTAAWLTMELLRFESRCTAIRSPRNARALRRFQSACRPTRT
eukprot:jgi/Chrpa1/11237/Chrysochromulina_OHIO_Genome00021443-RA